MPLSERLRSFLDSHRAEFTHSTHPIAFTAREVAAAEHLPPRELAKVVVIFGDAADHIVVIPANRQVDLHEVRSALGLSQARLATESELVKLFPDCAVGAMPPFGDLYGLPVYLDSTLAGQDTIAFNAGTHQDVIHMRLPEFRRLVSPQVVSVVREAVEARGW